MRSYIFTNRERRVLKEWLESKQKTENKDCLDTVLSRVKHSADLRNDVLLYNKVCEKLGITQQV